ncbi:hypothetical protein Q8791_11905 [Nocardiopsis sp. CT-R113]|uniref:Tetratricopeptide repeat protein n=1 Tax=Nocardiopsis codii TaxID=3065942 RepID=A0ABU7K6P6_9ACTN|nr:hypothetical protein [Nocardiopsis sp. CT-R113]MEE2037922.1 hypothetical protein [Nocardiopsis sp. CT-R113]
MRLTWEGMHPRSAPGGAAPRSHGGSVSLGEALAVLGDIEGAREALATALEYLRDHGDPRAGGIEARLGRLGG